QAPFRGQGSRRIYVFGNEHLAEDFLARKVAEHLGDVTIVNCRSPDELLDAPDETIIILDVVKGADKVIILDDVTQLRTRSPVSMHDFDLGYFLNLMKGLGMEKKIYIIGIPQAGDPKVIAEEVGRCIKKA
ncbi:TPA: hypothetical protein HA270_06765, partial [Candidatus Woesearchaeota archaeon]|nr:hypothetical protein [Candidatus Woesearchaeota archaeon]